MDMTEVLNAGAALGTIRQNGLGIPFVVVPEDYRLEDLENLATLPFRKRAYVVLQDSPSFIEYVNEHGNVVETHLYANVDYEKFSCSVLAVIDDHSTNDAAWREHLARFTPVKAYEWVKWTANDKRPMSQSDFATFLEDNLQDIATVEGMPNGSDMLNMALNFEANSDKRFKRRVDLQSGGVHFEFVDEANAETSSKFRFFERFTLGLPVFEGSKSAYPVEARLKFRQANDKLTFWFELVRADRVFRRAVEDELFSIKEKTGFKLLTGTPGLTA